MSTTPEPERMPDDASGPAPRSVVVVADATCTACGCLCDDIGLAVEDGRIVAAERACELGRGWFLADHDQGRLPLATLAGRASGVREALDHAAEILRKARSPVMLGLTRTSNEAVAAALALADRLGAVVDVGQAAVANRTLRAIQRVGRVSATLGEVKNRADVVVFWGVDPLVTHPRHWERYSVEPRGRFVPRGRAGRSLIVADAGWTATAARADWFVRVAEDAQFETLWTLRALARGLALDPDRVEQTTGNSPETLRAFVDRLAGARYGAWFHGPGLGRGRGGSACVEAALALVRDLNVAGTRFVILPLGEPGNTAGAESVLTWQAGSPQGVDFSGPFPRARPDESTAAALLERGEADAALIVADEVEPWLPDAARRHLGRIPRIVIAPRATATATATADRPAADVALAAATCGIDAPGTVMRVDGVVLPLRPPLASPVPSDRDWLRALEERIRALESRS
jgi:formylmethanofuran dehydrogenase subunit B